MKQESEEFWQAEPDEMPGPSSRVAQRHSTREEAETELAELHSRIAPLESEINQLGRQFWVDKKQVVANKYDLSANRYRELEHEQEFLESPAVTLDRLRKLEAAAAVDVAELERLLD